MKQIENFIIWLFLLIVLPVYGGEGRVANANGIEIWYETFGNQEDPSIMLVMGGASQGILWPTEFCEQLAKEGFYVIRYDHRDMGYSTSFNFADQPYDLLDLAKDAIGLLDALKIEKANIVGLSMGGPIAELMSVYYPERVHTITLIATSMDFRPSCLTVSELAATNSILSRPTQAYSDWLSSFLSKKTEKEEEKLEQRMQCWRILNGALIPFEEECYREIHREFLSRIKHPESLLNHFSAMKNSFDMIQTIPYQVKVPTLIFHGSEDPIFPPDHGEALAKAIKGSKYIPLKGMGHVPNKYFYGRWIYEIKQLIQGK